MNIFESVRNYFINAKNNISTPEEYCPNCWGKQEYEGRFLEIIQQEKIDLNNVDAKKGWIQGHAVKYFEGIKLKKTNDVFQCPTCKLTYK